MDRRGFLRMFGIGAAALAAEQAIPFGRVWSFPSKIVIPNFFATSEILSSVDISPLSTIYYDKKAIEALSSNMIFEAVTKLKNLPVKPKSDFYGLVHPAHIKMYRDYA